MLALWWISSIVVDNSVLLPTPLETANTLIHLLGTEKFLSHIVSTLADLSLGWSLCMIVLLSLAFVMLISHTVRGFLTDISAGWQSTPTFALAPIIIMAFGYSLASVLLLMAWGVIWYGINHLASDIQRLESCWKGQARNLGWPVAKQFILIYVPALAPALALIAKNSWSMMWRTLIAIEILFGAMSGSYGLGSFMNETRQQLLATETWSTMIVILVFGVAMHWFFENLCRRLDWR